MTTEQYRLLIKKTDEIWLSYDNDDAGNKATQKAYNMLQYKANIKQLILPKGTDPCDINDDALLLAYNNMQRII